jgi:hypothetical protein
MKLYFSTRQIPQLQDMSLVERLEQINLAQKKLIGPEKLLLNVLKLCILIPVFVFILQSSDSWFSLVWALLVALLYPILLKPIQYGICAKYIPQITKQGD